MSTARKSKPHEKSQSSFEYMFVYAALILVVLGVGYFLMTVFSGSGNITPSQCDFSGGTFCQDLLVSSSQTNTVVVGLLTNTNPYPIINPKLQAISSSASQQNPASSCITTYVLPGGVAICSTTLSKSPISVSSSVSGQLTFSYVPCPSGSAAACASQQVQSYPGTFSSTVINPVPFAAKISLISLSPSAASQYGCGVGQNPLIATATLFGRVLRGATINFSAGSGNNVASPGSAVTDTNGNAIACLYNKANQSGVDPVTASFANASAVTVVRLFGATHSCPQVPTSGGANLAGKSLQYCNLGNYNLAGDNLNGANLTGASLNSTDLAGANLNSVNLNFVMMANETLAPGANFDNVNAIGLYAPGGDFAGVNFENDNLQYAIFQNANLAGSDFQGANLYYANLQGAVTTGANFNGANTTNCSGCP